MPNTGPLNQVPIACALPTLDAAKEQVGRWQAFDADYALGHERTETRLTVHYAKVDDSVRRLHDLVAVERTCCGFVDWAVDETRHDLRLVVTGPPSELSALNVGPRPDQ
ncbi:hypothetical protein GCM10027063_48710 [Promicromonospora xylanilytica]